MKHLPIHTQMLIFIMMQADSVDTSFIAQNNEWIVIFALNDMLTDHQYSIPWTVSLATIDKKSIWLHMRELLQDLAILVYERSISTCL